MLNATPREAQAVQVRVGAGTWQEATYRNGRFIDRFGLVLNPDWITDWQDPDAPAEKHEGDAQGSGIK